ncbi:Putative thymocyte nuclear protein [Caligus rogercresseyi]|uniref:Thymocyte nuclear protein 1 n=1 Tax=Caligus rogercresseyi TaxID=217165 RepID=A0A7T8QVV5_CALRO|nr:Putative thymocyte nuclear protein [Caligus rogercresseyi]
MKFSLDDLKSEPNGTACWDGVRNYSARNWMRAMKVGQRAFFYHSNIKVPGIIGL